MHEIQFFRLNQGSDLLFNIYIAIVWHKSIEIAVKSTKKSNVAVPIGFRPLAVGQLDWSLKKIKERSKSETGFE